jgi:hypothetical protein
VSEELAKRGNTMGIVKEKEQRVVRGNIGDGDKGERKDKNLISLGVFHFSPPTLHLCVSLCIFSSIVL